jgi:predicted permease
MAAFNIVPRTLIGNGEATQLQTLKASAALLPVLQASPLLGRAFLPSEDQKGQDQVAIVSYDLWQRAFGGDGGVIGRRITLDDGAYEVVGVLPREFRFPTLQTIDLMTPLGKNEALELTRASGTTTLVRNVVARLNTGVSLAQARAEMEAIEASLAPPSFLRGMQTTVQIVPLHERFAGASRFGLLTLLCAVGCVLLLACANVANLLLGRSEMRRKEMAIRRALGASRERITQQLLVESLVLAFLGCGLGVLAAYFARNVLASLIPQTLPGLLTLPMDSRVLAFAVLSAMGSVLAFGLGPALVSAGVDASSALASEGRSVTGGVRGRRWLSALAALQMAIAAVLLSTGGLMLQSFWKLRYQDVGFPADRVVTATVSLSRARYPSPGKQMLFIDAVLDGLRRIPGVEGAGFGVLPPGEGHATNGFAIEGREQPPQGRRAAARQYAVSADFFRMLGTRPKKGREIEEQDTEASAPVALVSEAFVRSQFPFEEPIGRRLRFEANAPWRTIVGVVADIKTAGLASPAEPAIYVPYRQSGFVGGDGVGFLVRSAALDAASLAPEIRKQVAHADPQQPVIQIEMLDQRLTQSVARPRLAAILLGCFAALGLAVAALGLHSVMFAMVRSRAREIGVRLAIGGEPRDMMWLILWHSVRVMAAGLIVGIGCALWLSRVIESMWYGVSGADPVTFAGAAVVLVVAGLAASLLPAHQASRVDPMETLRNG